MGRHHDSDSGTGLLVGFALVAVTVAIPGPLLTGQWVHWLAIVAAIFMVVKVFGRFT